MVSSTVSPVPRTVAWTSAAVLGLASMIAGIDKQLPFLLMEPVKASFRISDTQIALLTGLSFSLSMVIFALPLSWVADRANRARLISFCIFLWCAATIGCGFAKGFWSLFILRMGVGLGESVLQPAGMALLADLFPPRTLPRALGLFMVCSIAGIVVASYFGGALYEVFSAAAAAGTFKLAAGEAWRPTFMVAGAAGLLVALAASFFLTEPRSDRKQGVFQPTDKVSFLAYLQASRFFYFPFVGSMCLWVFYYAGAQAWAAPLLARSYGWKVGDIGSALGLAGLVTSLAGIPLGIWLNKAVQTRLDRDSTIATIRILIAFCLPFVTLAPLASSGWMAVIGLSAGPLVYTAGAVIVPAVLTRSAPAHLRARSIAVSNLCYGLIGLSLGPVAYGAFTDSVLRDPRKLYLTMSLFAGVLITACLVPLRIADRRYAEVRTLADRSN